jgi:hypothetical protein
MATTPTAPASPAQKQTQIIVPIGQTSDGQITMARVYFDEGITKAGITKLRTFLESIEINLA